jgi:hypothetical protein
VASFAQLPKDLLKIQNTLVPGLMAAENKTLGVMYKEAQKLSSGSVSTEQLSTPVSKGGYGHPYGHGMTGAKGFRGPIPYSDPAKINKQTGAFYAAWLKLAASMSGGTISTILANFDKAANFLSRVTPLAIRRPIDDRVVSRTQHIRVANIDAAIKKIFKFK